MKPTLEIGHRTDVGRRREHNEDYLSIHVPDLEEQIDSRGTLLMVADGMGGHAAGEIASRTAIAAVLDSYYGDLSGGVEEALGRALHTANRAVIDEAGRSYERAGMGTTLAAAAVHNGDLVVANVGDSRVYLIRDGGIVQLSRDHSWIAEALAAGRINPEDARRHPWRNVVTRSLGGGLELEVDVYPPRRLHLGDIILVCSDGLWGMVPSERILQIVESRSAQAAADGLVSAANEAGGHDNITAIVCRIAATAAQEETEQTLQPEPVRFQDAARRSPESWHQ